MPLQDEDQLLLVNNQLNQCRICLDNDNVDNMISPCLCSGSSAYVHRKCLNNWRSQNLHDKGFKFCDICKFEYVIENVLCDLKTERKRYLKYILFVIRDSTAIILCVQSVIIGLAFIIKTILENNKNAKDQDSNSVISFMTCYLGTLFILFVIVGIVHLCKDGTHSLPSLHMNPTSNVEVIITFIIICILVLICAIAGVLFGIYKSGMILENIMKRHANKLKLRQETEISIVQDFQGRREQLKKC